MNDEKQAKDYNVEGGSVLHLVSPHVHQLRTDAGAAFGPPRGFT